MQGKITFSFGKNWQEYVNSVSEENIEGAKQDIVSWIGKENINGKAVLDIGSGSGIHSYSFYLLGASQIFSFDYDVKSVKATLLFWDKADRPTNWKVVQGSVLDNAFLSSISKADIVYSWGVLHHTGDMWKAIENASKFVKDGGFFFISIYAKGPNYERHLGIKQRFNAKGAFGKGVMIWGYIFRNYIWKRLKKRQNPFAWNQKKARGMTVYYDVIDWLGGLPYEVAYDHEITEFLSRLGFSLVKLQPREEGACHRLLYKKIMNSY